MKDLEDKMSQTPLRELPPSWRGSILGTARLASEETPGWREWLWPSPLSWAALVAGWMLAAVLFVSGPRVYAPGTVDATALSRDIQFLRERAIASAFSNTPSQL